MLTKKQLKYVNETFEEINKELSEYKTFVKKEIIGGLCHTPVVIREKNRNGLYPVDDEWDSSEPFKLRTPIPGVIKDGQIKIKHIVGRCVIGYNNAMRSIDNKILKKTISFLIENAILDVLDHHETSIPGSTIGGEIFLRVVPDKNGNYVHDLDYAAGFMSVLESKCGPVPPSVLQVDYLSKEQKEEANRLWNLRL